MQASEEESVALTRSNERTSIASMISMNDSFVNFVLKLNAEKKAENNIRDKVPMDGRVKLETQALLTVRQQRYDKNYTIIKQSYSTNKKTDELKGQDPRKLSPNAASVIEALQKLSPRQFWALQHELEDVNDAEVMINAYFTVLNEVNLSRTNLNAYIKKEDTKTPSFALSKWEAERIAFLNSDFPKLFNHNMRLNDMAEIDRMVSPLKKYDKVLMLYFPKSSTHTPNPTPDCSDSDA